MAKRNESRSVFDILNEAGDDLVTEFCDKLSEIYAYTQEDIIDFCDTLTEDQLVLIRSQLFEKLIVILPTYNSQELYTRRKKKRLCEDVYIIGYCVVSGLEDRRIKKILKTDPSNEGASSQVDTSTADFDDCDLRQFCASMKSTIEALTTQVNRLKTRVGILEEDLTSANCVFLNLTKDTNLSQDMAAPNIEPTTKAETTEDQPDVAVLNSEGPESKSKKATPEPRQNRIIPPGQPIRNSETKKEDHNVQGFHHSKNDRRKIISGQRFLHAAPPGVKKSPIVGNSHQSHRIQSADYNVTEPSGLALVYVGRLSSNASEDSVRSHLYDIGVTDNQLADVIKLNCRKDNESSFCISLNEGLAQNILFDSSNWPTGVRVRQYNQRSSTTGSYKKRTRRPNHYRAPPRLRNQSRQQHRNSYHPYQCSVHDFYPRPVADPYVHPNGWQNTENHHVDYDYDFSDNQYLGYRNTNYFNGDWDNYYHRD